MKLLRDQPDACAQRLDVVASRHRLHRTIHIVGHGQHRLDYVRPAPFDQLHLLAQRTLAIVVEFGLQTQVFVLPFGDPTLQFGRQLLAAARSDTRLLAGLARSGTVRRSLVARRRRVCHCVSSHAVVA